MDKLIELFNACVSNEVGGQSYPVFKLIRGSYCSMKALVDRLIELSNAGASTRYQLLDRIIEVHKMAKHHYNKRKYPNMDAF